MESKLASEVVTIESLALTAILLSLLYVSVALFPPAFPSQLTQILSLTVDDQLRDP